MSAVPLKKKGSDRWEPYPPEQARQLLMTQQYEIAADTPMLMRLDDTGELIKIRPDAPGFSEALERGHFATAEDYKAYKEAERERKYGDRPFTAAAMGLVKGPFFVGGDEIVAGLAELAGDPEAATEIPKRNPAAHMATEIGSSLVTGAAAVKGGAKITSKIIAKGAKDYVAKKAGKQAAKTVMAKAVGQGIAGGAEGLAYGVGDITAESSLGNQDLTAEQVVSHLGLMSFLGLGGGVVGEAAVPVAKKLGKKIGGAVKHRFPKGKKPSKEAIQRGFARTEGLDLTDNLAEDVARMAEAGQAGTIGKKGVLKTLLSKESRTSIAKGEQIVRKAETDLPQKLNTALKSGDATMAYRNAAVKTGQLKKHMSNDAFDDVLGFGQGFAESMEATAKAEKRYTYRRIASQLKEELAEIEAKGRNTHEVFLALDTAKSKIDDASRSYWAGLKKGATPNTDQEQFLRMYRKPLKEHLESDRFYGAAGLGQAEINARTSDYLTSHETFMRIFTERQPDGSVMVTPKRVADNLKKMGSHDGDTARKFLMAELEKRQALDAAYDKWYDLPSETRALMRESEKAIKAVVKDVEDNIGALKDYHAWREWESKYGGISNLIAMGVGGLAGGAVFGPVGAGAGALSSLSQSRVFHGSAMNNALRALTWLDDLSVNKTTGVSGALREVIRKGKPSPKTVTKIKDTLKLTGRQIPLIAYSDVVNNVMGAPAATNVDAQVDHIQSVVPELVHAPETTAKAANVTMQAAQYLKSILPTETVAAYNRPSVLGRKTNRKPPEYIQQKYLRVVEVLNSPDLVVSRLAEGSLTRDEVMAVKTVYPQIYQTLVDTATETLLDMEEDGDTVDFQRRLQLGILLDMPLDPTQEPNTVAALQATHQKTGAQQGQPGQGTVPPSRTSNMENLQRQYQTAGGTGLDSYKRQ